MPIRTPHGRAAAYRGIWAWPLRSPARLAITTAVVVVVAVLVSLGIGLLGGDRPGPGVPGPGVAPSPSNAAQRPVPTAAPVPTALPPVRELTPTPLPLSAAPAAALDVAQRWTQAWVRPPAGTTAQQWLAKLAPLTTDEYLGVLSTVDPTNITASRLTGPVRAVAVAPSSVRVQVPTDAFTLVVVVVNDPATGWRVADYDQA